MSLDYTLYNKQIAEARERGYNDALDLRNRSAEMDGTGLIDEERKIPVFDAAKNYISWTAGAPVKELVDGEYQVFTLNIPHNAAEYPGVTPNSNRTLWSITHTKDPLKAKPYTAPDGTSGLWMTDECCEDAGHIWRSNVDNGAYSPTEYAANWTDLGTVEEVRGVV